MKVALILVSFISLHVKAVTSEFHDVELVHFASDGMPLSLKSFEHINAIAQQMNFQVSHYNDPFSPADLSVPHQMIHHSHDYFQLGVTLHYPSLLVKQGGKTCGPPIPGYKPVAIYKELVEMQLNSCGHWVKDAPSDIVIVPPTFRRTQDFRTDIHVLGYFFKALGNLGLMGHGTSGLLFKSDTGKSVILPGRHDHFPSPDLEVMAVPAPLRFYDLKAILESTGDDLRSEEPIIQDDEIREDYESLGIVVKNAESAIYRVVTGHERFFGAKDYEFDFKTRTMKIASERHTPCEGRDYSLPMISRTAQMVAVRHNSSGTNKIVYIGPNADQCEEIIDLGQRAGKISFNLDDSAIAYITTEKVQHVDHYVLNHLDLKELKLQKMIDCKAMGCSMAFPDFIDNKKIIVGVSGYSFSFHVFEMD